ncbi:MAG TPA: hypothetical protein VNK04_07570 [Gemmataceae bacterium]|nr:hypothetical protein [Gemmataceae bacterium]
MTPHAKAWTGALSLTLALTLLPAQAGAAEVHKYLPDDTGAVVTINIRQILDSALVKKHALERIKQGLKENEEVQKVLDALGLDPLKDIDQLILASPSLNEEEKGLVIVTGRFDPDKIKAKAAEVAKNQPDLLKLQKTGVYQVYEVKVPDQPKPVFAAVADRNTLVASVAGEYITEALDKAAGQKKTVLQKKEIGPLLERMDAKQSVWVAVGSSALAKGLPAAADENVKEFFKKVEAIAGGVTVRDDIKAQFVLSARDVQAAKEMNKVIADGINQLMGIVAILAANQKELTPLVDVIKGVKTTIKDKAVVITAAVPAELIEKTLKPEP